MQSDSLYKLGLYLRQSKKDQEYLTFDEIEKIIGATLSDKAKTPHWWYNDCRKKQAQIWLSSGYKTIDANTIPIRKGVAFKKYEQDAKSRILYNRKIVQIFSYFIIPVLVALTASFLFSVISKEIRLTDNLQQINRYYAMNEVSKTEELIFEMISLREIDQYFFDITEGELLDYYLIELENALKNLSFSSNPSFFAYTKFELGKHYYYKAVELINQNESDDRITEILVRALDCCSSALMYYTDSSNSQIYHEIELLVSKIECAYSDLSIQ